MLTTEQGYEILAASREKGYAAAGRLAVRMLSDTTPRGEVMSQSEQRLTFLSIINQRRDRRYRAGVAQLACSLGIITHMEWRVVSAVIRAGEREIK